MSALQQQKTFSNNYNRTQSIRPNNINLPNNAKVNIRTHNQVSILEQDCSNDTSNLHSQLHESPLGFRESRNKSVDFGNNKSNSMKSLTSSQKATYFLQKYNDRNGQIISQTFGQIKDLLESMNAISDCIMQNHEKDFVTSYKEHMLKVQCELIHFKKKSTDFYYKMKKDERIRFLEQTINWFRCETMSLAKNLEQLKNNNALLKEQLAHAKEEKQFLKNYTKATIKYNGLLKSTIDQLKTPEIQQKYSRLSNTQIQQSQVELKSPISSMTHPEQLSLSNIKSPYQQTTIEPNKASSLGFVHGKRVSTAQVKYMHSHDRNTSTAFSLSMTSKARRSQMRQRYTLIEKQDPNMSNADQQSIHYNGSQDMHSNLDIFTKKHNNELLDDYYKQEIESKDKNIKELTSQLQQFKKKQTEPTKQQQYQQSDLQELFLDCIQSVKKAQFFKKMPEHMTHIDKTQILNKFMTNKRVLSSLYEMMFSETSNLSESKSLVRPNSQKRQDKNLQYGETISLSILDKDFLMDSKNIYQNNSTMTPNDVSPYLENSKLQQQIINEDRDFDHGRRTKNHSMIDGEQIRFRKVQSRAVSQSSNKRQMVLINKKDTKTFKVKGGKLLIM